jgi:hypothetical protein
VKKVNGNELQKCYFLLFSLLLSSSSTHVLAQFTDINAPLPQVYYYCSSSWGDYNDDGYLDIVLTGRTSDQEGGRITKIFKYDSGNFIDSEIQLPGVWGSSVDWGDYDNDGDLDLVYCGWAKDDITGQEKGITKIFHHNENDSFNDIEAPIADVYFGSVDWGDYDNDGDLDLIVTGLVSQNPLISIFKIYKNENGNFSPINFNLIHNMWWGAPGIWVDYDNDGDLDISFVQHTRYDDHIPRIYSNSGDDTFIDAGADFPPLFNGLFEWGDYDMDGDFDAFLTGIYIWDLGSYRTYSYLFDNNQGAFTQNPVILQGIAGDGASAAWGDSDSDGDLDLLLAGYCPSGPVTKMYRNTNGSLTEIPTNFPDVWAGSVSWGDYDHNGTLDLLLSACPRVARVYRNDINIFNSPPTSPTNLTAIVDSDSAVLNWNKALDAQTAQNGLTYNLRIGTTPGGCEIKSPMANAQSGLRKIADFGNVGLCTRWTLKGLELGKIYYWSVQAIDNSFAGSRFAAEQKFSLDNVPPELVVNVSPHTLWPPNHKMANIIANVTVHDACDPSPVVTLLSITSNEPDNGLGDGDKPLDIQGAAFGTSDYNFQLRSERSGKGLGRSYIITYLATDASGNTTTASDTVFVPQSLGKAIADDATIVQPTEFALLQNYSNPFNPETLISYDLPVATHVTLVVFNVMGEEVTTLDNSLQDAGRQTVVWDGRDRHGNVVSGGIYLYRLVAGDFQSTMRMLYLK